MINIRNLCSNHSGFTITEVAVSTVIFGIAVAGIFSVINYVGKQHESRLSGSYDVQATLFGQRLLEELRSCVDNDTGMTTGCLGPGTYTQTSGKFTADFTIYDDASGGRRVEMDVSW